MILLFALLFVIYAVALAWSLSPYWFNPQWTTDDALQQSIAFHSVEHPEIFRGDLIAETMKGYLAPLHYWLSYGATVLTGDPILAGHWVMLLQLVLMLGFVFLAVREAGGSAAPAFFAAAWLLHTRPVIQRITCGLPRGWAGAILAAVLYFMFRRNHWAVLTVLLCGCMLHPPATLIAAGAYGLFLIWGVLHKTSRQAFLRPLLVLTLLSPVYALITWKVVERPAEIGQMAGPEQSREMPEFQRPGGRFPFLPLTSIATELHFYGYNPFSHRLYNPAKAWGKLGEKWGEWGKVWKESVPLVVLILSVLLIGVGFARRRIVVPVELWALLLSIVLCYLAARAVPFKLYVPDRHLQFPLSILIVTAFPIAIWRAAVIRKLGGRVPLRRAWRAVLALLLLGAYVWVSSGDGLRGSANFNYTRDKRGGAFDWLRRHSAESALIAGHPTHIDGLPLFAIRRAYATTETAHPFYLGYYAEIKRRLIISLRAHYARDLRELYQLLAPEGVDYFVFARKKFYPVELAREKYFEPLHALVRELASRPHTDYAYKQLPRKLEAEHPYLVFRDDQSAVVDLKLLGEFLARDSEP